jgi:DNA polymerase elongation subunit (family B)
MAGNHIAGANDDLKLMPDLLGTLLQTPQESSARWLADAAHTYLGGQGLFSDPQAATDAEGLARQYVDRVLDALRARGCAVVGIEGEQILFGTPGTWSERTERELANDTAIPLPRGVELTFEGHYQALYARAPRSSMLLGTDGAVTLVGNTLRPGRMERFVEAFLQRAAALALQGDAVGLRQLFLETVHQLRTARIPVEDLCVQVTLHKSPPQYRRIEAREEPYEVLLAAGVRSWRVGQRIRYFRAHGSEPRLLQEGDATSAAEADTEYYVQRLFATGCQQFAQAFRREDFRKIFRLPTGPGPFEEPDIVAELGGIRPITAPIS